MNRRRPDQLGKQKLSSFCPEAEGSRDLQPGLQPGRGALSEGSRRALGLGGGGVQSWFCCLRQHQAGHSDLDWRFSESPITFVWSPSERLEGELSACPSCLGTWGAPNLSPSPAPRSFPPILFPRKTVGNP